ncbi:LysE family translocator [Streptomyces xanthochromogenes]|uniref:Threonine transporter RhtB n=1 Tax=Streptomyces xanthochromogenes TaxID=67384 RepID=A0ABQ3A7U9_9ACTN|nr:MULTISPECIES: LysE family translocator [Streptomyces]MYV95539.1 LysE family transporter [Streptomyces sp. SID1034]GGY40222.1 threonine transporter RhtB [Streptomyces xanthochromogenes]GHB35101.1 threonine transporter RhtB [Streptomyces xanthochromogenes]
MDIQSTLFASFLLAATVVCVTPGPDMLYVMSFGVSQGRTGGLAAAAGVAGGMLVHAVLSSLGVALLISQYPWLMMVFKGVGICYLTYLGVSILRDRSDLSVNADRSKSSYARIAYKAMIVNLTNPKVIVFYVAFLPQFTAGSSGWPVPVQMLTLGAVFVTIGFAADAAVGLASGALSERFAQSKTFTRRVNVCCGIVMFVLAAVLLLDI